MSYSEIVIADIRLIILQALHEDVDYAQNEHVILRILQAVGHAISHAQLHTQLAWLEEQGLITLSDVSGMKVAKLTERGEDAALGRARVPGVRRPGPGT